MATVRFVIPGAPRGKQTARVTRWGTYTPTKTAYELEAWKWIAVAAMKRADLQPFAGPVKLSLCAYMPVPISWSKAKRAAALAGTLRPISKPDWTNIAKLEDGLTGVVWVDDSQVVEAHVWKIYHADPRVVIEVTEL